MPTTTPAQNNAVLAERIERLSCDMQELKDSNAKDMQELKQSNADVVKAVNELAITYKVEHISVVKDVAVHEKRITALDDPKDGEVSKIKAAQIKLADDIDPLLSAYKVMVFISSILGVSIIALIWGIITHTVTVVMP